MRQVRVPSPVYERARQRQERDHARGIRRPLWEYLAEEDYERIKPAFGWRL